MSPPDLQFVNRREVLGGAAAAMVTGLGPAFAKAPLPSEGAPGPTIWGLPATPSAVLARAVASGVLAEAVPGLRFEIWKSTDQMRAGIVSGAYDLFATSTYAAANFHNRGAGTVLLNVISWGVLYIVARDSGITRIEDLAGRRILLSNKNEAPDLLFRLALRWSGLDPGTDVVLDYVGSPGEAVPLYLAGRGDVAVLHEPATTAALMRAEAAGLSLFRAIDVTEVYRRHTGGRLGVPQVGLAANPRLLNANPGLAAALHAACVDAGAWVLAHPAEAGALASETLPLPAAIIARSIPHVHVDVQSARTARPQIEAYFGHLMSLDPGIVGGRLPDPAFYWG